MANPVSLDPDALQEFANQLKRATQEMTNASARLNQQFQRLGETWRDPEYQRFATEFQQTMKNIERFRQIADETAPKLLKKAQRARDVHK